MLVGDAVEVVDGGEIAGTGEARGDGVVDVGNLGGREEGSDGVEIKVSVAEGWRGGGGPRRSIKQEGTEERIEKQGWERVGEAPKKCGGGEECWVGKPDAAVSGS